MQALADNLLSTMDDHDLVNLQHEATRCDNVLDLFCTNKPGLVKSVSTIPGFSDHSFILVDTVLKPVRTKKKPRKIYKWDKADWESVKQSTRTFTNQTIESEPSVEEAYSSFLQHVQGILGDDKLIPSGWTRTRHNVPWLSRELKRQCNKKHRLYKRAKKTKKPSHWEAYNRVSSSTKKALKKAHWQHVNLILDTAEKEHNTKPFWNYIKFQRQHTVGVPPLKKKGQLYSDSKTKASILQDQFTSVFTTDDTDPNHDLKMDGQKYQSLPPLLVRNEGILKLLQHINLSKSSGPDEVAGRLLKELAIELAPFLTYLFNKSLETGEVPSKWKEQWVNPIFKSGTKNEAANYRPVSLTCITSKLMEHVVCSHIRAHLDKMSILSPFQHGFRSGISCETQLLLTFHDLATIHDKGLQTDIGILDFSKAFDVVPNQRLLNKLSHYGIDGSCHRWIKSCLSGRTQKVMVDGTFSDVAPVVSGVPQGTVLGPLLFLLFINDLPSTTSPGTRIRLFADDCLIYRPIRNSQDQVTLQHDLDNLIRWSKQWGMRCNAAKCKVMRTTGGIKSHRFYHMDGQILQEVQKATYLGVTLSRDLTCSQNIQAVASKANRMLGFARRNLRGSPKHCKSMAYISLVRSGMEYASTIWDPYLKKDIDLLEKVQRKAARWVFSDYKYTTSVTRLLKDLNWKSLADRRQNQRPYSIKFIQAEST